MARILVVDDEEGLREFLAEALHDDGHATVEAADGEEALRLVRASSFDLVLTDLRMPGLSGLDLLRRLRAEQPETEVVVMTAYGTVESAVEAMKLGAYDYLQKPISGPGELRLVVNRALERRALVDLRDRTARDTSERPPLSYGDPAMIPVVEALRRVAPTEATVVLTGESGTGKEVAARAVHEWSRRAKGPFVAVNCAAISENLLESELFGHEKGAFTGAIATRRGRLELAAGGTFFLDEIAELDPSLQAKLLRVLQERRFERVGGTRTLDADVRWIAATHQDLETLIATGKFREDLYHRLNVFPVHLPALRERRKDILPLARTLLERVGRELGRPGLALAPETETVLCAADWPGNIRELANVLERAAILADGPTLAPEHLVLSPRTSRPSPGSATLSQLERGAIERALETHGGNRRKAAVSLGIPLRTFYDKLKRYELV